MKSLQVIKKGVLTILLWTSTALGALFIVAFLSIQIPYVQTRIIRNLTNYVSQKTDHQIDIGHVNISWFDSMVFEDLQITDDFDSTMIASEEVMIDFSLLDLIIEDDLIFDAIRLTDGGLFLQKVTDSTSMNLTNFLRKLKGLKNPNSSSSSRFLVGKVKLENATLTIDDRRKGRPNVPWDYYHLGFNNVDCSISDLIIEADTIRAKIDGLTAQDERQELNIKSFESILNFNNTSLVFDDLRLETDHSLITDSLAFSFSNISNLSYFKDSVEVKAQFRNSIIHPHDIQLFTRQAITFEEPLNLSGDFDGTVNRFDLRDFRWQLGDNSYLSGFIHMIGLPDIKETFMEIDLKGAKLNSRDLKKFTPTSVHPYLDSLKNIEAKASFLGFYSDFVANGSFTTGLGEVQSNLNLKLPFDGFDGAYTGKLDLSDFKLGSFLSDPRITTVTMVGSINGEGFTRSNADFFLNAAFEEIGYKSYIYQDITTNAEFTSEFFEGELTINDPNLKFNIDGTVDLRNGLNKVDFSGVLDTLNFQALNVTDRDIFLSTKMDLDFTGLQLDSIRGFVDLNDLYIRNEQRHLSLDSLMLISHFDEDERDLVIQNELLNFTASGDYTYSALINDANRLWKEYNLILRNERDSLRNYYAENQFTEIEDYKIDLELEVSDADPFIRLFNDKVTLGKDTRISGEVVHGETSIIKLNSHLDTLLYEDYLFYNNEFDLNTSKLTDDTEVLSMIFISSEKQVVSEVTSFNDFYLEGIWSGDVIEFSANAEQSGRENKARIFGDFTFGEEAYIINLKPSELTAIGRDWSFIENNEVRLERGGDISFTNLGLTYEDQSVSLDGKLSPTTKEALDIDIEGFQLDNINPLINQQLSGMLNAKAQVTGWGGDLLVQSDLDIHSLQLNDFLVGDLNGLSHWENTYDRLRLGFEVDRLGRKVIELGGYFYPKEEDQLDIIAVLDGTSLKVIEPFVARSFSGIDGSVTGQFTIEGPINSPILKGEGNVENGEVTVNYLNTDYTFEGDVIFAENEIGVRGLAIHDVNNHEAVANGGIFHDGFRDFVLDISTDLQEFQVVNTNSTDNELYYGTAYLTGQVNFLGSFSNLQISAKTTTNRGTRIFIPLSKNSSVEQEEFIKFVNLSESNENKGTDVTQGDPGVNLKGIKLDFDLDITPDAYTELIFDIKSGDIIRGRGNGKINLQINTDGDFMMFGDLVIANGGYNFTLKNIINKEFDLIEGSKISWYGDPYQGVMDITAEYRQLTSLLPLISQDPNQELIESTDARRKYPSIVVLDLEGPLLSPQIDFDIRIEDYPESIAGYSVGPIINAFNSKLDSDEQELKRQVFSLIVLRRFSPENSFNVGGGQTLGSSVSEFISNQLSYWVSQVDENLEIDVDLTSLDQDAFNTFQLRLAYTFLDGRLKVSRDGGFTNIQNEADVSTVVGDWTVEYLITPDGKLRAKMYNKTNYNVIDRAIGDQNNTTAGFSLQYTRSFDQFRELLFKARKSPKLPKEKPEDQNTEAVSTPSTARNEGSEE